MNQVSDILLRKGTRLVFVEPGTSVLDALKLMSENNMGSVMVMNKDEYMGLVTERDYSRKVILMGKHSVDTKVSDIMTTDLPNVKPEDSIDHCMDLMTNGNIRYLPVFEENKIKGIISITDVVKEVIIKQQQTINHLDDYIRS